MDYGWMDLLEGTGIATALRIVQWPKPLLVLDTYLLYQFREGVKKKANTYKREEYSGMQSGQKVFLVPYGVSSRG